MKTEKKPSQRPVYHFLASLFDMVLPPRRTDILVRALSYETLLFLSQGGPLPYKDARIKALVWELKYRKNPRALSLAAQHLYERILGEAEEMLGTPLLVPVPMHERRKRVRGYNQCEILCEELRKFGGGAFAYAPHSLTRTRATIPQQKLPRHYRLKNAEHSMECPDPSLVRNRVCIVVDDVETTGATMKEAARALSVAGAREVRRFSLARS